MGDYETRLSVRRALLLLGPATLAAGFLPAQIIPPEQEGSKDDPRLPNGKKQQDEILKADYERNLKDARDLIDLAKSFELDLEKDERFVLSVSSLRKLDDMEKLTKRLRGRLKRF
jgi:hypothetical protein